MRYFLIFSLSFFSLHTTLAQTGSSPSANYIYKCDSAIGPKSTSQEELSYKNVFLYNPDGTLKSDIEYNLNNTRWAPTEKRDYIYSSGKLVSDLRSEYALSSMSWIQYHKITYLYNSDSTLSKKLHFLYNQNINDWDTTSMGEYIYSNQGFTEEYIVSQKRPTGFEKNIKIIKYLNKFNLVDSLVQYLYMEGIWKIRKRETYLYDEYGYLKHTITMNSEYGTLQPSVIREVSYDAHRNPTFIDYHPLKKIYYKWELKYDLKGNNINTLLPFNFEDREVLSWFRNGLLIENKIYSRGNDSEDWMYTNEGGMLYYSRTGNPAYVIKAEMENLISISPNPTSGLVNIKVSSDKRPFESYSLKNFQGVTILEETQVYNSSSIDISQIPSGAYMLELNVAGEKYFKKIIKD